MDNVQNKETTLSQEFEAIQDEFTDILDSEASSASPEHQDRVQKTIKRLEELTVNVSAVDMFSKNEHFEEVNPLQLRFLMLPYMLGVLWQQNTKEDRQQICDVSRIYFKDYLKRCTEYGFIEEQDEKKEKEENPTASAKQPLPDPDAKRQRKIKKFKENRDLDAKISAYRKRSEKFKEESDDDGPVRELYESLIKRAINESEEQLESIEMEAELIKFRGSQTPKELESARNEKPARKPLQPFIITKDAIQKEVYGLGYPSLPVMTVEELYEQRRADGTWGPPPVEGHAPNPDVDTEELEAAGKELLEEQDNDAEIARRRQFDEYKDDHRRGWGNRFNRS